MIDKVFVYGTLRQGESNSHWIADYVKTVTPARVRGWLFDLGPYPAMTTGKGWVWGELIELKDPEKAFAHLDVLEDYFGPGKPENLYERIQIDAYTDGGEMETCQVYVFPERRKEELIRMDRLFPGGDWVKRKNKKGWVPYFAYGSCMNRDSFASTMSRFFPLGKGEVNHSRVLFTRWSGKWEGGVADLVESPGEMAEGILYLLHPDELEALDEREGASPHFYPPFYRREWVDVRIDGLMVRSLTYVVVNKEKEEVPPSYEYMETILQGTDLLGETYRNQLQKRMAELREKK